MPTLLGMAQGFPRILLQVLLGNGEGLPEGEPGCLLPAPHNGCDQPSEGKPAEFFPFLPLVFFGAAAASSEEIGEIPKAFHSAP